MDRLRARIEARRPPQPLSPSPYQTPANPSINRQAPTNPQAPAGTAPRVLATPTNPRYRPDTNPSSGSPNSPTPAPPTFGMIVSPAVAAGYRGLQVLEFNPGSNAPSVGIRPGDLIVSIDGVRTESLDAAAIVQRRVRPGDTTTVQIIRGERLYQTQLTANTDPIPADGLPATDADAADEAPRSAAKPPVAGKPAGANSMAGESARPALPPTALPRTALPRPTLARPRASLGVEARDATPQRGAVIVSVREEAAGAIAGLKVGDRVVSAAGRLVRDTDSLARELSLFQPVEQVTLGIVRGEAMQELDVEMGGPDGLLAKPAASQNSSTEEQSILEATLPAPTRSPVPTGGQETLMPSIDPPSDSDDPLALPEDSPSELDSSDGNLPAPVE